MPLKRRTVAFAKVESTYGTDPTIAVTDAFLLHNIEIKVNSETHNRPADGAAAGASRASVLGMIDTEVTFSQEIMGHSDGFDASTAPLFDPFLRGCGYSATWDAVGSTWTYAPVSDETLHESLAMEIHRDGLQWQLLGGIGTFVINAVPGSPAMIDYTFKFLWAVPTHMANPTPTYTGDIGLVPPIVCNTGFEPFGIDPDESEIGHTQSIIIDPRYQIATRKSVTASCGTRGIIGHFIAGRGSDDDPGMAATIEVEMPESFDTYDASFFWDTWVARTQDASATISIGTGASNNFVITLSGIVIESMDDTDFDGVLGHTLDCRLVSTTDNECVIVANTAAV